jgi:hypothetical protein
MLLFISWSGNKSRAVAIELQQWLQEIIQAIEPWMSTDIDKGSKWIDELNERLEGSRVGILCLTQLALKSGWIHYEAGALAKTKDALVCSLLLDVEPNEVTYPLAQFQQTRFEKEDLRRLVQSINKAILGDGGRSLPEPVLDRLFDRNWDRLNTAVNAAMRIEEHDGPGDIDPIEDMIGVVLLSRRPAALTIEDLVPAVLQAIDPKMPPQPPTMLAMLAGQFEAKYMAKLARLGYVQEANGKYCLTKTGEDHFQKSANKVKAFQTRIAEVAKTDSGT